MSRQALARSRRGFGALRPHRRIIAAALGAGWLVAGLGYLGPWIAHPTAALTLSGADMGEFVKFLPAVADGSLPIWRQAFYLQPFAVVVSVAILVGSKQLSFNWPLRVAFLGMSVPLSVQLLPPAWSPGNLATSEFRAQAIALGACWVLLATFWLWGRLPLLVTGAASGLLAFLSVVAISWYFAGVKPAIDGVYSLAPLVGWGLYLSLGGLAAIGAASTWGAVLAWKRSPGH